MRKLKNSASKFLGDSGANQLRESFVEENREIIKAIFEKLGEDNHRKLLSGFCIHDYETFDGYPIIAEVGFVSETESWLRVNFTGTAYFGCEDMNKEYEYNEVVTCLIERDREVTFGTETPERIERAPDEY